ncbi:MAG: tetratricopeptide repeat protein [Pseudobdellovibrio sp.]
MKNTSKIFIALCVSAALLISLDVFAQTSKGKAKTTPKVYTNTNSTSSRAQIQNAITQYKNGNYTAAAIAFHTLSKRSDLKAERPQLKMYLGESLMELGYNQTAVFQFVDLIKSGDARFTRAALEKLLIVTDRLGDETLLNYAIQRIDVASVPSQHREMLYYRMGQIKMNSGQYAQAAQLFERVGPKSRYYFNALYDMGLAQAEAKQNDLALSTFRKLMNVRDNAKVTDTNKVAAQMAIARVLYQKKDFEGSIEAYSKIPRDHVLWHDSVFERSWAMLRSARFRSVLSNFQSLHSSYYDNFYIPESLLLRSIVYLYICKYDEMEKVLSLYEKQYNPVQESISNFLRYNKSSEAYYSEIEKAYIMKRDEDAAKKTELPLKVANKIYEEGNVRRAMAYIKKIVEEKRAIEQNPQFRSSAVGAYALKIVNNRLKGAKAQTGDMVKAHLENMQIELKDLKEQASFIRYEMINGKKETIKKRIAGRDLEDAQVDSDQDRSFYVQNGYEYYPFKGEYWLDEVGNYHYLGKQSCE